MLAGVALGCDRGLADAPATDGPTSLADGPIPADGPGPRADAARDAAPRDASSSDARSADAAPDGPPRTYRTPADFDRSGCQTAGFDQLALDGVWVLEIVDGPLLGGSPPGARFFHEAGLLKGMLASFLDESPLDRLDQTAADLFFYQVAPFGVPTDVQSFLACHADAAASRFDGPYALCFSGQCGLGKFRATKVTRPAGEGEASGLVKLGEFGAFPDAGPAITANVRVGGTIAYLARYGDGLRVLDVADPAAMRHLAHAPVQTGGEIYNDVKLAPGVAFLASSEHGVVPYDVSIPSTPMRLPSLLDGWNVHTLFISGTTLYVAAFDRQATGTMSGLAIFDITNPRAPVQLGQLYQPERTGYLHDLYVEPGRAYLDFWDAGLIVVDVSDPLRPRELGRYEAYAPEVTNHSSWVTTIGGRKICVTGDESFGAHARILDVTDPAAIRLLGEWQTRPEVSIHNILAEGDRAYIAHYQDGLRVLDLSTPAQPRQIAYYNTWDPATGSAGFYQGTIGIDKVGDLLYVAEEQRGLLVLKMAP